MPRMFGLMRQFLKYLKNLASTSVGVLASQAINFLLIPALARLYSPDAFSHFGLYLTLVIFFSGIASAKYSDAIILPKTLGHSLALARIAIATCLIVSLISGLASYLLFKLHIVELLVVISLPISVLSLGVLGILIQEFIKTSSYRKYTFAVFASSALAGIIQAILGNLTGGQEDYLIYGAVAGHAVALLCCLPMSNLIWTRKSLGRKRYLVVARKFKQYPTFASGFFILSTIRNKAIYIILGAFKNPTLLGYYSQADRFLGAPTSLFSVTLRPLFFRQAVQRNIKEMGETVTTYLKIQWYLLAPALALFISNAESFIYLVLGPNWIDGSFIFKLLAVPAFISMSTTWLDKSFDLLRIQHIGFGLEIFYGTLSIVLAGVAILILHQPELGIGVLALIFTIYYFHWLASIYIQAGFRIKSLYRTIITFFCYLSISATIYTVVDNILGRHFLVIDSLLAIVLINVIFFIHKSTFHQLFLRTRDKNKGKNLSVVLATNSVASVVSHRRHLIDTIRKDANCSLKLIIPKEKTIPPELISDGVRLINMSRGGLNPFKELGSIFDYIKEYRVLKPDVVHHFTIKPVLYGTMAALTTNVPSIFNSITGLGYVFTADSFLAYILKPLVIFLYRIIGRSERVHFIFQNPSDRDFFLKKKITTEKKSSLIMGSGVNVDEFVPNYISNEIPRVLFAGRLIKEKGIFELLDAAMLLYKKGLKFEIWIAGHIDTDNPGSLTTEELHSITRKNTQIKHLGHRKDMPTLMSQVDIACLPSYREGLSMFLLEAMSCGKPIVTTDTPGCRETVIQSSNGIVVPVKNVEQLAKALEYLIENTNARLQMGKKSREYAEKIFSSKIVNATIIGLYKNNNILGTPVTSPLLKHDYIP